MAMNVVEKTLARSAGREEVTAGEIIDANVDVAMIHDLTGPHTIESFHKIGAAKVWNPDKIVVIFDHMVPASTTTAAELHQMVRKFVKEQGIKNFHDVGQGGICHQVMPERGYVRPGEVIIGADSHSCTYGALGAFSTGVGATDMAAVFTTGKIWLKVPRVIKVHVTGEFRERVAAKDLVLHLIGRIGIGGANYKGIEWAGPAIRQLPIDGRLTLCNMAVEAGGKCGIVEADEKTEAYVKARTRVPFKAVKSDADADYDRVIEVDASELEPQVACPSSVDNVKPVSEVQGVSIDQAFIGSCTNGRIEDFRLAASLLKGRKVHPRVRLIITPASQLVYNEALKEGLVQTLMESGAVVTNSSCGACIGGHLGVLGPGDVCISSSSRNFIGRMGSKEAKVYLGSPITVAAAAVAGQIVDPRKI